VEVGFAFEWKHLHWWVIGSVAAIALVYVGLRWLEARRFGRLHRFVEARLAPRLMAGYDAALRRPLSWLTLAGCVCFALTFAQPHWGQSWQEIRKLSRDVVVLLDTSQSMRAQNPLPDRLERAKQKINGLIDTASGDRFALIAFAGAAELQCPLTLDHGYFKSVLQTVDTDTISREGTDIDSALDAAINVLKEEDESTGISGKSHRAILLISDGEQVSGDALQKAEEAAQYARIFVIGVGDPRGAEVQLPNWMARYMTTKDGKPTHFSVLDESTLQQIALKGNGAYTRSRLDASDVEDLFQRFDILAARDVSSDVRLRLVNRFQWPLAAAIAAFAGEGLWLVAMPWVRRWRLRRESATATGEQHA
jgi:Ca-activated chloride channel family protein